MPQPAPAMPLPQSSLAFPTRIKAFVFKGGQVQEVPYDPETLRSFTGQPDSFVWLDVLTPTGDVLKPIERAFQLHPLAIEDALHGQQRAKVEPYDDFWFVTVHSATISPKSTLLVHETAVFIGEGFVITSRYYPSFEPNDLLERWQAVPESWRHQSSSLVYVMFDSLVDGFLELADTIEAQLRQVRSGLTGGKPLNQRLLARILALEELSHEGYNVAVRLRDVLPPFVHASEENRISGPAEAMYYRDIHDHAISAAERLNSERYLSDRIFDIYQSMAAQQQGDVARQLTVVATIFLPLTFLTGFFGQNFDYLVKHIASEKAFVGLGIGSYVLSLLVILFVIRHVSNGRKLPVG